MKRFKLLGDLEEHSYDSTNEDNDKIISKQDQGKLNFQDQNTSLLYRDQSVQVDIKIEEQDQGKSPSLFQFSDSLSQVDMLLVNPEDAFRYNQQNLLEVKIQDLAKIYTLSQTLSDFIKLNSVYDIDRENKLFHAFKIDWKKSQKQKSTRKLTLAKMRTLIVRDAMNNFVDSIIPPQPTQDYHFRISKTYKHRYALANVPVPPSRVNNSFLQNIFCQQKIRNYYRNYLDQKLVAFLKDENFKRIKIYTLELMQILHLKDYKSVESFVQLLQKKKKPFTIKQLDAITVQAYKIVKQYGVSNKRIGNGRKKNFQLKGQQQTIVQNFHPKK